MKTDSQPSRNCLKCHYPLHALPEPRCPECGREFDPDNPKTYTTKKRWRGWKIIWWLLFNPIIFLAIGWYIHFRILKDVQYSYDETYPSGWYVSGALGLLGIAFLLFRRWGGIALLLLSPAGLYMSIAAYGYFIGPTHFKEIDMGTAMSERFSSNFSFERNTRLPFQFQNNPRFKGDWFEIKCHNATLHLLGTWFGRASGTYDGPIPSKKQAEELALSSGTLIVDFKGIQNQQITINNQTYPLSKACVDLLFEPQNRNNSILHDYWNEVLPLLAKHYGSPCVCVLENKCILFKIHDGIINQYIDTENTNQITQQRYYIFILDAKTGEFLGVYNYNTQETLEE